MEKPEVLFQGKRFRVERAIQAGPDGTERSKEVVRHPGAATILPLLDDGRVCLVRNNRVSVEQVLMELPAGTVDPGEDPAETARRELAEETGYRAARFELLSTFYMTPGITDEKMWLYLATGLQPGPMQLDAGEDVQPLVVPWQEALDMVRNGRIQDAKTLVGLLYYEMFGKPEHR